MTVHSIEWPTLLSGLAFVGAGGLSLFRPMAVYELKARGLEAISRIVPWFFAGYARDFKQSLTYDAEMLGCASRIGGLIMIVVGSVCLYASLFYFR